MPDGSWGELAAWWIDEADSDPAYAETVHPLALQLLDPQPGRRYLDVGCGDGRLMAGIAARGAIAVGCDVSQELAARARRQGEVVVARVPDDDPFAEEAFDGAVLSLVLEHLGDVGPVFRWLRRVVRGGGNLAIVSNHPVWTAPDSGPIVDGDGEVLWRTGSYFSRGVTSEPAGSGVIRFYHRPMADLLNTAAEVGWCLDRVVEMPATAAQISRVPLLRGQEHIPRLLGVRWRGNTYRRREE